jgi:penicillin-binding protein 1A
MSFKRVINNTKKKLPLTRLQKIFYGILVFIGVLTGVLVAQIIITFTRLNDIRPLETYSKYSVPTKVYDINEDIITEFFYQKREILSYKDMPEHLINALIATEDNRFYKHGGFNAVAAFKGVVINPLMGRRARGGSTITQQLAKGLFTGGERTAFRKAIELWYAFQIEKKYSKEEILELYFNQFYFGHGCYGIESAAQFYFDKRAKDLTLSEASLLVGLVQAPSRFSPIFNPYAAQSRHRIVLRRMVETGFITHDQSEDAFETLWANYSTVFRNRGITASRNVANPAPHFTEYIRQILIDRYGEERLYTDGLQIYTTLDLKKQAYATEELRRQILEEQEHYDRELRRHSQRIREENEDIVDLLSLVFGIDNITLGHHKIIQRVEALTRDYNDLIYLTSFAMGLDDLNRSLRHRYLLDEIVSQRSDFIEGAIISVNPKNGYIEAMVGGREFTYANQYNRAVQARRQLGSAFKPIYYAIALDNRLLTAASTYDDKPIVYENEAGALWAPRNYTGTFRGTQRVRQALQFSINIIAVQVWHQISRRIGYSRMIQTMSKMFDIKEEDMRRRVGPQMAYSLGVSVFTPLEVATAFSVFANEGKAVEPMPILRVRDRYGRIIDDFAMERESRISEEEAQVISPAAAFIMQDMLRAVLYQGTGARAVANAGFSGPAGGKTGTTANWKDGWFAGFTRDLTTVVWVGFDDPDKSLGRHRSAAVVAAPVWARYMRNVSRDNPPANFPVPAGVVQQTVCFDSGMIPTPFCPHVISEYFIAGTSPVQQCAMHTGDAPRVPDAIRISSITDVSIPLDFDDFRRHSNYEEDYDVFDEKQLRDIDLDLNLDFDF